MGMREQEEFESLGRWALGRLSSIGPDSNWAGPTGIGKKEKCFGPACLAQFMPSYALQHRFVVLLVSSPNLLSAKTRKL